MPIQILMPALSPTMTHGTLTKWIKKEGDNVESGELIAEIETDKATMEIEAVEEGKLVKIIVPEGTENVEVNKVIGLLLEEGEDLSNIKEDDTMDTSKSTSPPLISSENKSIHSPDYNTKHNPKSTTTVISGKRIIASPLAKRIAVKENIDLSIIKGSGPHGRIIQKDIKDITKISTQSSNKEYLEHKITTKTNLQKDNLQFEAVPHTNMRKTIARRLTESARDIPHFNISVDIQIDAMLDARKRLNANLEEEGKISINDFIIKCISLALSRVPSCNVSFTDEAILFYKQVDISFAVSIDGGLITPIIKDVVNKSFSAISRETKELVKQAKAGKLKPEDYEGGTFTISNMGMFGIKSFNSIINPPQAAILSVGAGQISPVVDNGSISTATIMNVTLAVDHRCIDGATAADFIRELKSIIEEPLQFML